MPDPAIELDPDAIAEMLADASERATGPLLGDSTAMQRVREVIGRAAPGTATVLVRGETGTGKELIAREIHDGSDRARGPLVVLHCAALPDSLLESELFGYEKGAFTGAQQRKKGRVEMAHGGTLFLDEIGDVTPATQVKLLRLLQERTFERVGGSESIEVDVRFVAATHRNLEAMIKRGEFRGDLFYRINVVPVWVPPLRARRGDVVALARHFCATFAEENDKRGLALSEEAEAMLRAERWPGNVRQLQNVVERLVVLCQGAIIGADELRRELSGASPFVTEAPDAAAPPGVRGVPAVRLDRPHTVDDEVRPLDEQLRTAERRAIEHALRVAGGNRSKAARLLGVSRQTLHKKLNEHGLRITSDA